MEISIMENFHTCGHSLKEIKRERERERERESEKEREYSGKLAKNSNIFWGNRITRKSVESVTS